MRIIRYQSGKDHPRYGWVQDNQVGAIDGDIFTGYHRQEASKTLNQVKLLSPVKPTKIICVGRNYLAHIKEHNAEIPEIPLIFLKPSSSIIGPFESIMIPPQSKQVEHEAELVVVMGKKGRWIAPEDAMDYILGYTIGNDITARDLQYKDGQWTRAKGFDTFCPIGPWIETEIDPSDAIISCYVNDEMRQMASTREMVFNIRQLIAFISSVMTLEPGDTIFTGTPAGVGVILPGDHIKITIEGIGSLENTVSKNE